MQFISCLRTFRLRLDMKIVLLVLKLLVNFHCLYANSTKISCFLGFWNRLFPAPMNFAPFNVPANSCDFLIYAFVTVNTRTWKVEHRYRNADINQGGFQQAVSLKKQNPNLEVILSVGGMPYEGIGTVRGYSEMMKFPLRRRIFVESVMSFMTNHNFDGLELHWYYPGSPEGLPEDKENFLALVKELSDVFIGRGLTLLATVPYLRSEIEAGFDVDELVDYLDYLHVRTIDMNVYGRLHADTSTPLKRRSFDVDTDYNVESVLEMYTSLGAPKEKLIFGIPFQGHSFILQEPTNDNLGAPTLGRDLERGNFSGQPGSLFYHEVCARIMSGKWIQKRDQESGMPYIVNPETSQWASYEDTQSIAQKVNFAKTEGYGGVFVWLIADDDFRGLCGEKHILLNTIVRLLNPT